MSRLVALLALTVAVDAVPQWGRGWSGGSWSGPGGGHNGDAGSDGSRCTSSGSGSARGSGSSNSASGSSDSSSIVTDPAIYSRLWGQISTYADNPFNYFGVQDVGIPSGCQIEQVHTLQRHANRFPTSALEDGTNDMRFAGKLTNYTTARPSSAFSGPLSFLNSYEYILGSSYLTGLGAVTEMQSGVQFWNRYGRTLYNASVAQLAYNASNPSGSARPKPVLRTTGQSRIWDSQINWALGFFGTSFQMTPDPTLEGFDDAFDVVVIPEGD